MYIACNSTMQRGYFLGDVLTCIKSAWLFVETEQVDQVMISLHPEDPLTCLWWRFIRQNEAEVVWDHWRPGDQRMQYKAFDARRKSREVANRIFEVYKELYPRMDGGMRQTALCGKEAGLRGYNIFEYYYFGQESFVRNPNRSREFGRGVVDMPPHRPVADSIYVAPWEKCHGNGVFRPMFWVDVVSSLSSRGISVTLNDNRGLFRGRQLPDNVTATFPPLPDLAAEMANYSLIVSGNTGVGWLAGAGEYPLVSAEHPQQNLGEYLFSRCGFKSLRRVVEEPDPQLMIDAIQEEIDGQRHERGSVHQRML